MTNEVVMVDPQTMTIDDVVLTSNGNDVEIHHVQTIANEDLMVDARTIRTNDVVFTCNANDAKTYDAQAMMNEVVIVDTQTTMEQTCLVNSNLSVSWHERKSHKIREKERTFN
jgi:hypothetical protein